MSYMNNYQKYGKKYYQKNKKIILIQHKEYKRINRDFINQMHRKYYHKNRERILSYAARTNAYIKYNKKQRLKALNLVGKDKIVCTRCGCDDYRLLEINHINGGGAIEYKKFNYRLTQAIASGKRNINGLELLCKPCNGIHALELKYKEEIPLMVIWHGGIH